MKTTVLLKDEIYAALVDRFGKRNLSSAINRLLSRQLFKPGKRTMFGSMKRLDLSDLEIEDSEFEHA
jgi:molybdopterin/thiamine biosynthesis adenylyltransferase